MKFVLPIPVLRSIRYDYSQLRTVLLISLLISISASISRVAIQRQTPDVASPMRLQMQSSIGDWQLQHQAEIPTPPLNDRYDRVIAGQRFIYQSEQRQLTIELRDVRETFGNIGLLQNKYLTPAQNHEPQKLALRAGTAYFITDNGQTSIQTCISSNARISVTASEFQQNAYQQSLDLGRLVNWLIGRHPLMENRCLWMRITSPSLTQSQITEIIETMLTKEASDPT